MKQIWGAHSRGVKMKRKNPKEHLIQKIEVKIIEVKANQQFYSKAKNWKYYKSIWLKLRVSYTDSQKKMVREKKEELTKMVYDLDFNSKKNKELYHDFIKTLSIKRLIYLNEGFYSQKVHF